MTTPVIGGWMTTPKIGGFTGTPKTGFLMMTPMTGLADAAVEASAAAATVATAARARIEVRVDTGYLLRSWIIPSGHWSNRRPARFRSKIQSRRKLVADE